MLNFILLMLITFALMGAAVIHFAPQILRPRFFIGDVRRALMLPFSSRWNAMVRDCTARLEGRFLISSDGGSVFHARASPG